MPDFAMQKFGIIERVAPRYDSGYVVLYSLKRRIKKGTIFVLVTDSPNYDIVTPADDKLPATYTVVDTYLTNVSNIFDHDDNTYAYSTETINAGAEVTEINIDLGALYNGFIYVVFISSATYGYLRIYISSDNATFTKILDVNPTSKTTYLLYVTNTRYISVRYANTGTSAITLSNTLMQLYSLEFYPANIRNVLSYLNDTTDLIRVFSSRFSQFLEVISI